MFNLPFLDAGASFLIDLSPSLPNTHLPTLPSHPMSVLLDGFLLMPTLSSNYLHIYLSAKGHSVMTLRISFYSYLYICISIYLSILLAIYLSFYLSVYLSTYLVIYLSIYLFVYLLSIHKSHPTIDRGKVTTSLYISPSLVFRVSVFRRHLSAALRLPDIHGVDGGDRHHARLHGQLRRDGADRKEPALNLRHQHRLPQ